MSTEHACLAAAEEAAHGIAPVRAILAPVRRPTAPRQDAVPLVIRMYLEPNSRDVDEDARDLEVEPVSAAMGAVVLAAFLEGLHADRASTLTDWYARLTIQIPHALGLPAAAAPGMQPKAEPSEWQALAALQTSARELLTLVSSRADTGGHDELGWRLAMVEDLFSGALRRLLVPAEPSLRCAAELMAAAGSLFGLKRTASAG